MRIYFVGKSFDDWQQFQCVYFSKKILCYFGVLVALRLCHKFAYMEVVFFSTSFSLYGFSEWSSDEWINIQMYSSSKLLHNFFCNPIYADILDVKNWVLYNSLENFEENYIVLEKFWRGLKCFVSIAVFQPDIIYFIENYTECFKNQVLLGGKAVLDNLLWYRTGS